MARRCARRHTRAWYSPLGCAWCHPGAATEALEAVPPLGIAAPTPKRSTTQPIPASRAPPESPMGTRCPPPPPRLQASRSTSSSARGAASRRTSAARVEKPFEMCRPEANIDAEASTRRAAPERRACYDGMTIFERPALREYAAMCNDPSGFEDRKYVDEAHAKTRPLDDCLATRTGRLSGLNGTRWSPATPSGSISSRRSRGDRLS